MPSKLRPRPAVERIAPWHPPPRSAAALKALEPAITTLARAEGLEAHARSVEVRRGK